jgi:hypothetical protein
VIATLDDVQCPSCRGAGVRRGPQNDLSWLECRYCDGTGIVTEQRFQDWKYLRSMIEGHASPTV